MITGLKALGARVAQAGRAYVQRLSCEGLRAAALTAARLKELTNCYAGFGQRPLDASASPRVACRKRVNFNRGLVRQSRPL